MCLQYVDWKEASYNVYDEYFYSHFCTGSGSVGVVCKLDRPGGLVPVAVDVFFHVWDLSVVGPLGADEQDFCHTNGFVDGMRHAS